MKPRFMPASMVPRTPGTAAFHRARARGEQVSIVTDPTICLPDDYLPRRISNASVMPHLDASMGYSGPLNPPPEVPPADDDNKSD